MKKKATDQERAVATVKARISPAIPCVNADEEGYCTGPCEGSLCFKCADYRPLQADCTAAAPALPHADNVTALTVQVTALPIPEGSPAEQANALHCDFLRHAVTSKLRAIQCGWVLALQRERLGHGQWMPWVAENLDFTLRTVQNYLVAFHTTVGAYRAQMRRPLPLSVEPTVEEITAAAAYAAERQGESNAKERPLAALYRETGVVEGNQNWGGKDRGQGRKPKDADVAAELEKVATLEPALWASAKGSLDNLVKLDAERGIFLRLSNEHLAQVAGILADLAKDAGDMLKQRLSGKITETMDTAEAVSILEKGL